MNNPETPENFAENAERELLAQLAMMRALKPLNSRESQQRVITAVQHILAADQLVPGIFAALHRGLHFNDGGAVDQEIERAEQYRRGES